MSLLSRLFGGAAGEAKGAGAKALATEEYKGFTISAMQMAAGGEFQLAGKVEKELGGEMKMHEFVRADRLPNKDEAAAVALAKGRQLVDEQGDKLFS